MPMFGTLGNIETLWAQLKTSETKEKIVNAHGNDANFIENRLFAFEGVGVVGGVGRVVAG